MFEQAREVDVEQLVPVQREDVARLLALTRRKADTPSSPEPLGLLGDRDFDAEAAESGRELLTSSGAATDDYTVDSSAAEQTNLPGGQRAPGDRHEWFRQPAPGLA